VILSFLMFQNAGGNEMVNDQEQGKDASGNQFAENGKVTNAGEVDEYADFVQHEGIPQVKVEAFVDPIYRRIDSAIAEIKESLKKHDPVLTVSDNVCTARLEGALAALQKLRQ